MNNEFDKSQNFDTIPVSPLNIAFKWAAIGALLGMIQILAMYYLNDQKMSQHWSGTLISIAVSFFCIYMAIKEHRDKNHNGFINFGKAFKAGFLCSLIMCVLGIVFMIIFYNLIADFDSMMAEQSSETIAKLKEQGKSDEEISKILKMTSMFSSQPVILGFVLFGALLVDTIISLIAAAILKKESNTTLV